jgi:TonB family protein
VASVVRYTITWKIDWGLPNLKLCRDLKTEVARRTTVAPADRATNTAVICTCFEGSGKPRNPELVQSTGSSRFDEGAMGLARQAATRPRPPGHQGCFAFRIKFEQRDAPEGDPQGN